METPVPDLRGLGWGLLPDDLDQNAFPAKSIELAVKDLLPRSEVESPTGDGHHHLSTHDRALEVRVGIILSAVVFVLRIGLFRSESLEPFLKI